VDIRICENRWEIKNKYLLKADEKQCCVAEEMQKIFSCKTLKYTFR